MNLVQETQLPNYHQADANTPSTILPESQIVMTQKDIESLPLTQPKTELKNLITIKYFFVTLGAFASLGVIAFVVLQFILLNKEKNDELYDMVKLTSSSALCLDGSNAGYHISRTGDPSKILIQFAGGGWCSDATDQKTLQACYQRSFTVLGTSNQEPQQRSISDGSMSKDPRNYFNDWKKVYFHYCDGTGHQGTRIEPIQYKDRLLYFRGHNITVERFDDLEAKLGLFSRAQKVVISGESAGALAATIWTNYLAERVQNGKVWSVLDAGLFYDSPNIITKTNLYKESFANLMKISNSQIDPPVPECLEKFPNSKQNCLLAQNLYEHIKTPLFIAQSLYDVYSISQIIGAPCILDSIPSCSNEEFAQIEENRLNVTAVLQKVVQKKENGVWGISCAKHQTLTTKEYLDDKYSVNENTGYTANRAIGEWLQNPEQNNVHLDMFPWPNNRPCA